MEKKITITKSILILVLLTAMQLGWVGYSMRGMITRVDRLTTIETKLDNLLEEIDTEIMTEKRNECTEKGGAVVTMGNDLWAFCRVDGELYDIRTGSLLTQ